MIKSGRFVGSVNRSWTLMVVVALTTAASGCARSLVSIESARTSFAQGDIETAHRELVELTDKGDRFSGAAALDLALVELARGDTDSAQSRLRKLRDQYDRLPAIQPVTETLSVATDDTVRQFRASGYEQVMIRTMLALCSLASDGTDAESYAMQAVMKQSELMKEAESKGVLDFEAEFQPIAIAPYVRGVLREATHRSYDDAARAYQLVSDVRPEFGPAKEDIERATEGTHSAPGHGVLYVFACVGRGPTLLETTAPTTSTALSIASSVLNAETNRSDGETKGPVLPNIASVKIPAVALPPSEIAAVGVHVNGQLYGASQTLTDVYQLALDQTRAEMPWTIARAVVRRAAKETTVAAMGDALGLEGSAGSLFHFAASSAWSGSENADTRCWGLLPREIQVLRAELPAGRHRVKLQPMGYAGIPIGTDCDFDITITDGRNSYVVAFAPDKVIYHVGPRSGTDQPTLTEYPNFVVSP